MIVVIITIKNVIVEKRRIIRLIYWHNTVKIHFYVVYVYDI